MTTTGRFRHRTATLTGGPFDGGTARIYPDVGRTGAEPATIHLCLGTNWPHWQPLGWAIYTRQPDGGYTWTATVDQDTPVKPPGIAADGLEPSSEGEATPERSWGRTDANPTIQPWAITSVEHTPDGPDIAHFADGYRMPLKPKPRTALGDYWQSP